MHVLYSPYQIIIVSIFIDLTLFGHFFLQLCSILKCSIAITIASSLRVWHQNIIMLPILSFLIILFHASKCTSESSKVATCPTWTYPSPPHNECVCGSDLHYWGYNIICDPDTLTVTVILTERYFCIFFSEELQTTLVGTCPYGYHGTLPRNPSKIKEGSNILCFHLHQTGQLCGECEEKYTLSAYSYYLGCIKCEH